MFHLDWLQTAVNELTDGWLASEPDLREAISGAIRNIETGLERDPFAISESRADNLRVCFSAPLTVFFTVDEEFEVVTIVHARVFDV